MFMVDKTEYFPTSRYRWMTSYKLHLEDAIDRMKKGQNIHGRMTRDQLKKRESVSGNKSILRRSVVSSEPFPKQALVFMCLQYKSFENTVEKEKLLVTSNFSFSGSVFYPFGEHSATFIKF